MTLTFTILALVTLAGAIAAMSLRNLVHCALCLMMTFGGLAALFLQLTRGSEPPQQPLVTSSWILGVGIAVLAFGSLAGTTMASYVTRSLANPKTTVTADAAVHRIGESLMKDYVLPLELVGLLLTAALIGAVLIAMQEKK